MKSARIILFLIAITSFISADAARYWIAGSSSNWNNTANWSNTSGGPGGFSVPGTSEDVFFDNLGIGACIIDATVDVKSITVAASYPASITQGINAISTVNAASFAGGTFIGGSAGITIKGNFTVAGSNFTSTSDILEVRGSAAFTSGTFLHNNGSFRFNGNTTTSLTGTSPIFFTLEFVGKANTYNLLSTGNIIVLNSLNTSGTLFYNLVSGVIDVQGNINSSNTATGCGGDAMININGTGIQNFAGSSIAGGGALPQLTINKSSGSLVLSGFPGVSNNFTYTSGTVNAAASTFCFTHGTVGSYNMNGTLTFNNLEFFINTSLLTLTIPLANTFTATGNLTIAGNGNLVLNTGNIDVNGNIILTNVGNGGGGSAVLNIIGSGNQLIDASSIVVNQSRLPIININKPGGILSLAGNISFSANVIYTAGAIDAGVSSVYIVNNLTISGSFSLYNLLISPAGNTTVTIAAGSTVTATHLLDMENGSNYINIMTGTIAVQGDIINNNTSTAGGGTGTIMINGAGSQSITSTGVTHQGRFPSITINKPSGTLTLPSLITVRGNWTYSGGTIDYTSNNSTVVFENTLTISGTHSLNNVVFDGSSNFGFTTAAGTTLTISGTMSMIGTGNIGLNSGNINLLGNLVLSNTSVGGGGSSIISFVSTTDQSIISTLPINQNALPSVTINKTGGTLIFPALITVKGNWTYTAGILDLATNNSTVVFARPIGLGTFGITGTHSLRHVIFEGNDNNTATINTGTILTVTGTLSTIGAFNMFIHSTVAGTAAIYAQGDILINNTSAASGGTAQIVINGTGAQTFTGMSAAGLGMLPHIRIQKATGTLTLAGTISVSRDWNYVSGIVDASSNLSTVAFGGNNLSITSTGMNFHNVTFRANTSSLTNNITIDGNFLINGTGVLSPGSNSVNVSGNWTNRGTVGFTEGTSTVSFNGSTQQIITCAAGENFANTSVNNSGAGILLANDVTVASTLNMIQGNINLNGNNMTLGISVATKGTLARTSGIAYGTGSFKRWFNTATIADGNISGLFPVGAQNYYRPFFISAPVTGPSTGGVISISYADAITNSTVSIIDGAANLISRKDLSWNISTANGLAGGLYNLRAEASGLGTIASVNDLRITLVSSIIGSAGVNAGTTIIPQVNRTGLSLANLTNSFYVSSINEFSSALPVTLVSFSAVKTGNAVKLSWQTSQEINNSHFIVQRSRNGVLWEDMTTIAGSGNTNINVYYNALDEHPYSAISYYRLQQVDANDKRSYSVIRSVNFETDFSISIYPNPTTDYFIIKTQSSNLQVKLYNDRGESFNIPIRKNGNNILVDISMLPVGHYFVKITDKDKKVITSTILKM